jgi:hypothetical protein
MRTQWGDFLLAGVLIRLLDSDGTIGMGHSELSSGELCIDATVTVSPEEANQIRAQMKER